MTFFRGWYWDSHLIIFSLVTQDSGMLTDKLSGAVDTVEERDIIQRDLDKGGGCLFEPCEV